MFGVTVRHFTEADIPVRTALLRESRFQANLTDFAVVAEDDALAAGQRRTLEQEHAVKRIFTLCGPEDRIVGFAWITSIDWRSQSCELSFGVLPQYRGGFGAIAVAAAHEYLRTELNMRVVINQVLEHNTMLHSAEALAAEQRVRCPYDSYTVGEWRTSYYWSTTEDDIRRYRERTETRRREIAERIRARRAV
ncbi:MAG TPA: GNAT family N-acetyltransferase [Actinocrinis sp.]|jgi:RimJ/RimL family protein N-acetyltransferase|uniref:GNAT family N-acetyltransferase n=1 Tax=Actinocrinis sp. TaxID=1920516 RepID=UPI002DDD939D|nr:GNAT family N-acetyltransferase [Actinocrinis sp.]HEV3170981.1 GNAT family N-acetyltransferase [Actinocrinis sp.]